MGKRQQDEDDCDGFVLVENVGGVEGGLAGIGYAVTWGSNYIVSTHELDTRTLDHERQHIRQAREMGDWYFPVCVGDMLFVAPIVFAVQHMSGNPISFHDSHPMERDALVNGSPWRDPWQRSR